MPLFELTKSQKEQRNQPSWNRIILLRGWQCFFLFVPMICETEKWIYWKRGRQKKNKAIVERTEFNDLYSIVKLVEWFFRSLGCFNMCSVACVCVCLCNRLCYAFKVSYYLWIINSFIFFSSFWLFFFYLFIQEVNVWLWPHILFGMVFFFCSSNNFHSLNHLHCLFTFSHSLLLFAVAVTFFLRSWFLFCDCCSSGLPCISRKQ